MRRLAGAIFALLFAAIIAVVPSFTQVGTNHTVTQADMDRWKKELSNWGRWGKDDQKGALNLITPEKRRQAAALVKEGFAVSLARDADTQEDIENTKPYEQVMTDVKQSVAFDRISVAIHGSTHTHLDALGHHFFDGKMYNGFSRDQYVTMKGGVTMSRTASSHGESSWIFRGSRGCHISNREHPSTLRI